MSNPFDNNPITGSLAVQIDVGGGVTISLDPAVVQVAGLELAIGTAGPAPFLTAEPWAATTAYVVGPPASLVTYNNGLYVCKTAHTSTGTFDATKWTAVLDTTAFTAAVAAGVAAVAAQQTTSVAAVVAQETTSKAAVVTQETASVAVVTAAATPAISARDAAIAARDITTAARDVTTAARDVTTAARDTTLGYRDGAAGSLASAQTIQTALNALAATVSSNAVAAAQANASAQAVTGLSILASAARAIRLTTTAVAMCPDDASKWIGGDVRAQMTTQSWATETLGTATRGNVAAYPSQAFVAGETALLSIFAGNDPTGPLWKSFVVAGLTCVFALNGSIWYGGTGGLYRIDLIADAVYKRDTSGLWIGSQNVASYNQSTVTWTLVSAAGAIASNTIYSVAATVLDLTQKNPLRCNLPHVTVAVGTSNGLNVIRWDGVVTSAANSQVWNSCCFDDKGNLWGLNGAYTILTVSFPAQYMAASFPYAASWQYSVVFPGTPYGVVACGLGMIAVRGNGGLARIKLDPTNPANSLISIKTSTYDTGWMVLGKTVLALAESSADLTTLTASGELVTNGTFDTNTTGWTNYNAVTSFVSTAGVGVLTASGANPAVYQALTTVVGKTYYVAVDLVGTPSANVFINVSASVALNDLLFVNMGITAGRYRGSFVATATTTYLTISGSSGFTNGQTFSFDNVSVKLAAADRSGSVNCPVAVGSPTRTVVASGADTAGYGVSSSNYFTASRTAAMDWASNDFCIAGWSINAGNSGVYAAYQDGVGTLYGTNPGWAISNWNGAPSMQVWDGAGHQAQLLASANQYNWTATGSHKVVAQRRGNIIEIYVDGVKLGSTSCSAVTTVTNTSAQLLIGALFYNAAIGGGSTNLANMRVFNTSLTPDQIAFMYDDERKRFNANAIANLTGSTNVQGLAFDPDTGQLAESNSTGGTDVFAGPGFSVRVANQKSTTATNKIRNSQLTGAVVGTPGTMPTDCVAGLVPSGVAVNVVGKGYVNGNGYVDLQIVGTPAATQSMYLYPGGIPIAGAPAASGQSWTAALQMALVGGALTNIGTTRLVLTGVTSGGSTAESQTATFALNGTLQNVPASKTMAQATTATACLIVDLPLTSGQAVNATIRITQPFLAQVASFTSFSDGLANNDNHKAVAFNGGDLVIATGAGVDAFLPSAAGLRETAKGTGAPKRAFYDPTVGRAFGLTTDATPTVIANIPIPEGKSGSFEMVIEGVQYGGTATERDMFVIEGVFSRDLGGNVSVAATTRAISQVTGTTAATAAADTTNQTLKLTVTGKAATRLQWSVTTWIGDSGLMSAA